MIRSISGEVGELRWGYRLAGTVGQWTARKNETDAGVTLSGTLTSQNAVWISQRPLVFTATHPKGMFRWECLSLQISGGAFTSAIRPVEETSNVQQGQTA